MKANILYFVLILCSFQACVEEKASTTYTTNSEDVIVTNDPSEANLGETVILRDPVNIVASTGEDYPKTLKDIGFPVMPNSEVANVGNSDVENGTVVMQLKTQLSIEQINEFYKRELPKINWTENELKIYSGADGALSFESNEYKARVLIIQDRFQDFRKVAITLNKNANNE